MKCKVVSFRADRNSGWLFNPVAPQVRQRLAMIVIGELAPTLTCNVFRAELPADKLPTRNVGFLGSLPQNLWTGETYRIGVEDTASGETFREGALGTSDAQISTETEVSGDVRITEPGEVAGWVARAGVRITVKVLLDSLEIFKARTNRTKLRFRSNALDVTASSEFAFATQVQPEYLGVSP